MIPSSSVGQLPSDMVPPSDNSENAPHMVIWGTDVQLNDCKRKFKRFIQTFQDSETADDEKFEGLDHTKPYYQQRLNEITITLIPFLNVNSGHIQVFDEELYRQLIQYPQEVIPILNMAVNELFFDKFPDTDLDHQIQVRPYNAEKMSNLENMIDDNMRHLLKVLYINKI